MIQVNSIITVQEALVMVTSQNYDLEMGTSVVFRKNLRIIPLYVSVSFSFSFLG